MLENSGKTDLASLGEFGLIDHLTKHFEIVNTQKFIKRRLFFVVIYQQLRISIVFRRFLNAK